jgi:hypothetical protein
MNLHHGDIVNLIKDSGYTVTLTIGAPLGKWIFLFNCTAVINVLRRTIQEVLET